MAEAVGIIKQTLADAKSEKSKQRKRYIEKLIDYYTGTDTWRYIGSYFDADSFNEIPVYDINVTKKFIDKKSRVYTLAPTREIDNSKNKSDAYSKLTRKKRFKDEAHRKNYKFGGCSCLTCAVG